MIFNLIRDYDLKNIFRGLLHTRMLVQHIYRYVIVIN